MSKKTVHTDLPIVKCNYGCGTALAGKAVTWGEDNKGRFRGIEHPVCNRCGTTSFKVIKK